MHDLLNIMKVQNELLHNANKKLKDEISELKRNKMFALHERDHQSRSLRWGSKLFCKALARGSAMRGLANVLAVRWQKIK